MQGDRSLWLFCSAAILALPNVNSRCIINRTTSLLSWLLLCSSSSWQHGIDWLQFWPRLLYLPHTEPLELISSSVTKIGTKLTLVRQAAAQCDRNRAVEAMLETRIVELDGAKSKMFLILKSIDGICRTPHVIAILTFENYPLIYTTEVIHNYAS